MLFFLVLICFALAFWFEPDEPDFIWIVVVAVMLALASIGWGSQT